MHHEKAQRAALMPEALADPPSPAGSASPSPVAGREPFAEFMTGKLPPWALVRHRMDPAEVADVAAAVKAALDPVRAAIAPGSRVCLAVGSRGIDRIDEVVRAAVWWVRSVGAEVFVVPAMGSHGGATPEGQLEVLASYGITPETIGCEIRSSMETVELGEVRPGVPVFVDRNALEGADVIVPINRVKPHTDFTGEVESGLMKMIAIGLGKQRGADTFHRQGFATFHELIPAVAEFTASKVNIPFGLALVENGYARLWRIEAVSRDRIWDRERELLVMARDRMARLPLSSIDVLVLDYIGKDISGLGMDSNVVGRYYKGPTGAGPSIQRIVVRDLTAETEGNAVGIGMADVVLRRAVEKMDTHKTYMNCITAKTLEGARVPLTVDTDRQALSVAIASCLKVEPPDARIVRIRDTKHLGLFYVSRPAIEEVLATGRCEIVRPLEAVEFDGDGMFASPTV
jgi:Lactate racemase N-terminal domain